MFSPRAKHRLAFFSPYVGRWNFIRKSLSLQINPASIYFMWFSIAVPCFIQTQDRIPYPWTDLKFSTRPNYTSDSSSGKLFRSWAHRISLLFTVHYVTDICIPTRSIMCFGLRCYINNLARVSEKIHYSGQLLLVIRMIFENINQILSLSCLKPSKELISAWWQ